MSDNRSVDVYRAPARVARHWALLAVLLCTAAPSAAQCCRVSFPGDELVIGGSENVLRRGRWRSAAWRSRTVALPPTTSSSPGKDRKSTRLNSSHVKISYAVFCWKKKKIA